VAQINGRYYWLFQNKEQTPCIFDLKMKLELRNLVTDSGDETWNVKLRNGEDCLRYCKKAGEISVEPAYSATTGMK